MKLLLDTQCFLWFINGDERLGKIAQELIENPANLLYISIGSLWEMAIKMSLGKLVIDLPFDTFITQQTMRNSVNILEISTSHIAKIVDMPFHHRDPFDRLIIAQSLVEEMPVVTADGIFEKYSITRYW